MALNIEEVFEKHNSEYIKFERIPLKRSNRPDLHAFLLLDELCPGKMDIISSAEHDEIYLSVEPDDFAEVATEEQIIELIRCGVRYSGLGFQMFV